MSAHTACSRDEPVPKLGPATRMVAPAYCGLVEHEVAVVAPSAEEPGAEAGALDPLEPVARDDLVGVDVGAVEGDGGAGDDDDGFHGGVSSRSVRSAGAAKWPAMAVAAATAGDTRWVRPPRPWRPSKLRLEVEAQRSPGASLSGFMARHIEQPGSRQSNAGGAEDLVEPSASAWAFTRPEPGTTRARTPGATWRPCGHLGGGAQVLDAAVGARADEHGVDRDVAHRRCRRPGPCRSRRARPPTRGRPGRRTGRDRARLPSSGDDLAGVGAPGDVRRRASAASSATSLSKRGAVVGGAASASRRARCSQSAPVGACGRPSR